jgi:TolA-binding protein
MTRRRMLGLFLAATALNSCVASKQDVLLLQTDLKSMRAEYAYRDSTRRVQFDSVMRTMVILNDSIRGLKGELAAFQGNVLGDLFKVRDGLIEIRALTGQSQSRITELRAELEQRNAILQTSAPPASTVPPPSAVPTTAPTQPPVQAAPTTTPVKPTDSAAASSGTPPVAGAPGPNQLYTMALDQLRRGSTSAARAGFTDFLVQQADRCRGGIPERVYALSAQREGADLDVQACRPAWHAEQAGQGQGSAGAAGPDLSAQRRGRPGP